MFEQNESIMDFIHALKKKKKERKENTNGRVNQNSEK